ncbi:hypothetical protein [Rheinheimera fenheensis]|uniref:hypothetical protein n=1 Tax=Rheinheimera fenheensis TaxID=3152295 RepID=UPI00325C7C6A
MPVLTLKIRRKFLAKAINHVMGYKTVSGRQAADMYAQLLGYANNNNLNHALMKNDSAALRAVRRDWTNDSDALNVVKKFVPEMTSARLHTVNMMSKPDYAYIFPELVTWSPTLATLIRSIDDLNDLRWSKLANAKSDGIAFLLEFIAGKPQSGSRGRYRLLCIVEAIDWLVQAGVVFKLRLEDIYVLFKLENYEKFIDRLYDDFSGVEPKGAAGRYELERIKSLSDKEQSALRGQSLFFSDYEAAFKVLGVNTQTAKLTSDVDNAMFKYWGGIANYRRM